MKIAVQDANVLIDLELAGLFDLWFQLGIGTHTTDLIKGELEDGGHVQALAYFKSGQVQEHGLSFEELDQVSALEREVGSKAKFNDCSVLFLAVKLDAMLISPARMHVPRNGSSCVVPPSILWRPAMRPALWNEVWRAMLREMASARVEPQTVQSSAIPSQ